MASLKERNPLGTIVLIISVVFYAFAVAAIGLRVWSRKLKRFPLNLSDYSIMAALLTSTAVLGLLIASILVGLGQHTKTLTPEKLVTFAKLEIAFSTIWILSITAVKISILHLYITIFRGHIFTKVCWVFLGFQIAFCASVILQIYLICRPLALYWNPLLSGTCGSEGKAYLSQHVIILIFDISLAILPLPILWKLKMPTSKKITVTFFFSIGILICAISLLRIIWYTHVDGTDTSYDWAPLYLFSCIEPFLGIFLACLPFLKPVTVRIGESSAISWSLQKLRITGGSGSSSRYNGTPNSKSKNFNRLPERLNGINGSPKIHTTIETHTLDDLETQDLIKSQQVASNNSIQVTREWDVNSRNSTFNK